MELERRFTVGLELRKHNGKPRLEGLAVPYEKMSEDIGFRETIARGAFTKHLKSDPDVRALVEHDSSQIIGRPTSGPAWPVWSSASAALACSSVRSASTWTKAFRLLAASIRFR